MLSKPKVFFKGIVFNGNFFKSSTTKTTTTKLGKSTTIKIK